MPWQVVCECGGTTISPLAYLICPHCGRELILESGDPSMPRRAHEDTPRKLTLSLPESLVAQIELRLIDPVTMRPAYGSMSALAGSLLREWLARQVNNAVVNNTLTTETTNEQGETNATNES